MMETRSIFKPVHYFSKNGSLQVRKQTPENTPTYRYIHHEHVNRPKVQSYYQVKINELKHEINQIKTSCKCKDSHKHSYNSQIYSLKQQIKSLKNQRENITNMNKTLLEKLKDLQEQNTNLKLYQQQLILEMRKLMKRMSQITCQIVDINQKIDKYGSDFLHQIQKVQDLVTQELNQYINNEAIKYKVNDIEVFQTPKKRVIKSVVEKCMAQEQRDYQTKNSTATTKCYGQSICSEYSIQSETIKEQFIEKMSDFSNKIS